MKANITIARASRDTIIISLQDLASRIKFVEMTLSLEDFALAITGLAHIEGEATYKDLQYVGKKKIVENRTCSAPVSHDENELDKWLIGHGQEEGWILGPRLRSRNSIGAYQGACQNDTVTLHYSVYKYIEEPNEETKQ